MSQTRLIELLEKTGARKQGHFKYSSGRHGEYYLQCALILQYPKYAAEIADGIRRNLPAPDEIEAVVGPATGAILLAHEVARSLGIRSLFTERVEGSMELRRGFTVKPGEKVLIVEDVVTTGGSVCEVFSALEQLGADICGIHCIIDRSGGQVDFKYPFYSLAEMNYATYSPEECPLCAQGKPIVKPGSNPGV